MIVFSLIVDKEWGGHKLWDHSAMFAIESFDSLWMEIEHSSLKFTLDLRGRKQS